MNNWYLRSENVSPEVTLHHRWCFILSHPWSEVDSTQAGLRWGLRVNAPWPLVWTKQRGPWGATEEGASLSLGPGDTVSRGSLCCWESSKKTTQGPGDVAAGAPDLRKGRGVALGCSWRAWAGAGCWSSHYGFFKESRWKGQGEFSSQHSGILSGSYSRRRHHSACRHFGPCRCLETGAGRGALCPSRPLPVGEPGKQCSRRSGGCMGPRPACSERAGPWNCTKAALSKFSVMCLLIAVCPCACQVCRLRLSGELLAPGRPWEWREGRGEEGPAHEVLRRVKISAAPGAQSPLKDLKLWTGWSALHVLVVPGQRPGLGLGGVVVTSAWRPQGHFPERWRGAAVWWRRPSLRFVNARGFSTQFLLLNRMLLLIFL